MTDFYSNNIGLLPVWKLFFFNLDICDVTEGSDITKYLYLTTLFSPKQGVNKIKPNIFARLNKQKIQSGIND